MGIRVRSVYIGWAAEVQRERQRERVWAVRGTRGREGGEGRGEGRSGGRKYIRFKLWELRAAIGLSMLAFPDLNLTGSSPIVLTLV